MSKSKTVQCGGCGEEGHNKRTCPERTGPVDAEDAPVATAVAEAPVTTVAVVEAVAPATEAAKGPIPGKASFPVEPKPPSVPSKKERIPLPPRPRRDAPTGDRGTAATAAPFRCPKCNSVAILALVKVKDYARCQPGKDVFKGDQRCENCLNKPDPATMILRWGTLPGETISVEDANA